MKFSKEFLKNKFFRNQALGFNPPLDEKIGETRFKSGAILQPNGDYLFKILYLIFDYPHKHYTFKYFEV